MEVAGSSSCSRARSSPTTSQGSSENVMAALRGRFERGSLAYCRPRCRERREERGWRGGVWRGGGVQTHASRRAYGVPRVTELCQMGPSLQNAKGIARGVPRVLGTRTRNNQDEVALGRPVAHCTRHGPLGSSDTGLGNARTADRSGIWCRESATPGTSELVPGWARSTPAREGRASSGHPCLVQHV